MSFGPLPRAAMAGWNMESLVEDGRLPEDWPGEEGEFPLSYGQRALWFLDRLAPGNPAYVIAGAARIWSAVDPEALQRAAMALAARHPGLRTTFHEGPVQRVEPEP